MGKNGLLSLRLCRRWGLCDWIGWRSVTMVAIDNAFELGSDSPRLAARRTGALCRTWPNCGELYETVVTFVVSA
jgi:hypothetical protein